MGEEKKKSTQTTKSFDDETLKMLKQGLVILPHALTAKENLELLKKYKETGDLEVRNQIICGNLRFAVGFSFKYFQNLVFKFYKARMDDLVQDLSIWLMEAVEKCDLSKEVSFSTFAGVIIRTKFCAKNRKSKLLKNNATIVSFYSPASVNRHGDVLTYEDTLMDEKSTEETFANNVDLQFILKNIVPTLTERERKIFKSFFIEQKTKAEIAQSLGLSKTYVGNLIIDVKAKVVHAYENGVAPVVQKTEVTSFQQALLAQNKRNQSVLTDYFQGVLKIREIAQKNNISKAGIDRIIWKFKKFCKEQNIEVPQRQLPPSAWATMKQEHALAAQKQAERNQKIWEDHLEGKMSQKAIARKYSMTAANVRYILSKFKGQSQEENGQAQTQQEQSMQGQMSQKQMQQGQPQQGHTQSEQSTLPEHQTLQEHQTQPQTPQQHQTRQGHENPPPTR